MATSCLSKMSLVLLCSILLGCGNDPSSTPAQSTQGGGQQETSPLVLTSKACADILTAGDKVFSAKLANRSIEIVGEVSAFRGKNPLMDELACVVFHEEMRHKGSPLGSIECWMVEDEPWKKIQPGQVVHIKGIVAPQRQDNGDLIVIEGCTITKAEPLDPPLVTIDVETFVAEFLADAEALETRFQHKNFILTGKLDVIGYGNYLAKWGFTLSAEDGVVVHGSLEMYYFDKLKSEHKSGDPVSILVQGGMRVNREEKYIALGLVYELSDP